ncbi:MAG: PulJ/GspJ family protein [Janthinobacterium lividum]
MRADAGFTLVELLVSLGITAMTAALLLTGLGTGRRVWEHAEASGVAGESVAAAQSIVRDRVERLVAETSDDPRQKRVEIDGTADRLDFLAPPSDAQKPAGLQHLRLALGPGGALLLSSVDALAGPAARWTDAPLIGGVAALAIGYYGAAPPDREPRWRSAWRNQASPPQLVRVRLRFAAGDRRRWPDVVVRPAATVASGCTLDRLTGDCQA